MKDGCYEISRYGECAIHFRYPTDFHTAVTYEAIWAATRIIHARHNSEGKVAGYVSLDDYYYGYKAFVTLTKRDAPAPQNMKRTLLEDRQSALKSIIREEADISDDEDSSDLIQLAHKLMARAEDSSINLSSEDVPNARGLSVNVRIGFGDYEFAQESILSKL